MDEFLEHMLSIPSWSDTGVLGRNYLGYNGNGLVSGNGLNIEQLSASKIFKASALSSPSEHSNVINHSDLAAQRKDSLNEGDDAAQICGRLGVPLGDRVSTPYSEQREMKVSVLPLQGAAVPQSGLLSMHMLAKEVPSGGSTQLHSNLTNSQISNAVVTSVMPVGGGLKNDLDLSGYQSFGSRGSERSVGQQVAADCQSPPAIAASWCQPYSSVVSPLPLSLGPPKSEAFLAREEAPSGGANVSGRNLSDGGGVVLGDICADNPVRDGSNARVFPGFGATQVTNKISQPTSQQVTATTCQGQQTLNSNQGLAVNECVSQPSQSQPQCTSHHVAQTVRPRVRARRGQATDPHSIAERLRRERIAERMRALQELVPNANKTDKASMLDEIIDYVKFLQLQVKVLSMSRLGGARAIAPLVADIHSEGLTHMGSTLLGPNNEQPHDGVTHEHEVAQLMEDDMGSAMQYLQSKGLCLMPISLATAMSCTTTKPVTGTQTHLRGVDSEGKTSVAVVPMSTSLTGVSIIPPPASSDSDGGAISKGMGSTLADSKESTTGKVNATDVTPA